MDTNHDEVSYLFKLISDNSQTYGATLPTLKASLTALALPLLQEIYTSDLIYQNKLAWNE